MEAFNKSVADVKKIKSMSNKEKLNLYKYYKQVNFGDNNTPKPWAIPLEPRAKWDAWNSIKGMSKEEAMRKYVAIVNKHLKQ